MQESKEQKYKINETMGSRREFLTVLGGAVFMLAVPLSFTPTSEKIKDEDEYIVVNGWLLKKEDLNDI